MIYLASCNKAPIVLSVARESKSWLLPCSVTGVTGACQEPPLELVFLSAEESSTSMMAKAGSSWHCCSSAGPLSQGNHDVPLFSLLWHFTVFKETNGSPFLWHLFICTSCYSFNTCLQVWFLNTFFNVVTSCV